jgi:4-hydroxy-4-methyl-2-oxoglutarate aldolase
MNNQTSISPFRDLSTPLVADACVRLGLPIRLAPGTIRPLLAGRLLAGRVLPARHYGSVDVFLEAMEHSQAGDVLVIDNGGRNDEGCIGDLTVLEAQASQLRGIVVWGCHRDTAELVRIGVPVFTEGTCPVGPTRLDPREDAALTSARMGRCEVGRDDFVFADDDGVIFITADRLGEIVTTARAIWETERQQAMAVREGRTLREQLQFKTYLTKRTADKSYTFRKHLRALGGAIEE